MISRRSFLATTTAATALLAFSPQLFAMGNTNQLKNFGFIGGIIGKELKDDWKAALKKAAEFGFTEIETGNFYGKSAKKFLNYCAEVGIKPVVGGVNFSTDKDELNKKLDLLQKVNIQQAVTYWPWKVGAPFKLKDCKTSAEILNTMGEVCKSRGITFSWHNHNNEFIPMEQGLPFDYLMENTQKDLVKCEMDIYWVAKGGADPLSVLKKYAGRIPILHVKDMTPGEAKDFECPGSGIIDFPSIFREANAQGIKHFMVERDNVPDGMACLKSSGAYLKNLTF